MAYRHPFKRTYTDKDGKKRQTPKWHVEIRDHNGLPRRLAVSTSKARAHEVGRRFDALVRCRENREAPDAELREWRKGLEALGANVEQVVAYRAMRPQLESDDCLAAIDTTSLAIVTFASPSAIDGLTSVLGRKRFDQLLSGCSAVVIGPTTARALQGAGFAAAATAERSTLSGLARAVEKVAADGRSS